MKAIDFPITYPKNIQCSELNISAYQRRVYNLVRAVYMAVGKVVEIEYTCYFDERWGMSIDYNTQIIDNEVYTNLAQFRFIRVRTIISANSGKCL